MAGMEAIARQFLREDVECHFNWGLEKLETNFSVLERFEAKLRDKDLIVDTPLVNKWSLRLSYGYEMFKKDKTLGIAKVKEAVEELDSTSDELFVKYKVSFQHVACSLLANMLLETKYDVDELKDLISKIILLKNMPDSDRSGVLGLKANVLRWYGSDGTKASIPAVEDACNLCPEEYEWKISRVIALTRMRHFSRTTSVTWADVALPVEILQELIKAKDVIGDREVTCKYFLAVNYKDMIRNQEGDPDQTEKSKTELSRLCKEIQRSKTTSPQVVSFCATQLAYEGSLEEGISMVEKALEVFPRHVGLHSTISNLYKSAKRNDKVLEHSKIALDEGGYGAAWIYLESVTKAKIRLDFEEFFNKVLNNHPSFYKAQTHVSAAMFYFFQRGNVLRGSSHMKSALETNPTNEGLVDSYCKWTRRRVNPMEIAYNQIHIYLRSGNASLRDQTILGRVQQMISSYTDVTKFVTSRDLVRKISTRRSILGENRPRS